MTNTIKTALAAKKASDKISKILSKLSAKTGLHVESVSTVLVPLPHVKGQPFSTQRKTNIKFVSEVDPTPKGTIHYGRTVELSHGYAAIIAGDGQVTQLSPTDADTSEKADATEVQYLVEVELVSPIIIAIRKISGNSDVQEYLATFNTGLQAITKGDGIFSRPSSPPPKTESN